MHKTLRTLLCLLSLASGLSLIAPARADDIAPDVLVKSVTDEVLGIVKQDREIQNGNSAKTLELVKQKVLPYFNFTHMTRLAVARNWRLASPEQQQALTNEFRTLLVRTYSNALNEYRNQTVEYKPLKMKPGDTDVKLNSEIRQPGAQPIQLAYYMEKTDKGWQAYDIEVGGISLITNYRDSFATEIQNNGIDGLIKSLRGKNQSGKK